MASRFCEIGTAVPAWRSINRAFDLDNAPPPTLRNRAVKRSSLRVPLTYRNRIHRWSAHTIDVQKHPAAFFSLYQKFLPFCSVLSWGFCSLQSTSPTLPSPPPSTTNPTPCISLLKCFFYLPPPRTPLFSFLLIRFSFVFE